MLRTIFAPLAGLAVAIAIVALVEGLGHIVFPPPAGLDMADPADQARLIESLPAGALAAVLVGWFLGSMAGAATAMTIARRVLPGWTVGLAVAALGLFTTLSFPHPDWMKVAAGVLPLLGVLAARTLLRSRLAAV